MSSWATGISTITLFVENPRAVLEGSPIDYELPTTQFRSRKWYQFWA